jgi:hypothetical protein
LDAYGLGQFAKELDYKAQKQCVKEGRTWGVDIPSDRLLKGIGYISGNYFNKARKALEDIEIDPAHTLLSLFLIPGSFAPQKPLITIPPSREKVEWILKHFKYERRFPEIALKAYAAIGDTKKVEHLLNRGVKDSLGPEIPLVLKKSAIEFCLNHQNAETFNLLLEKVPLSEPRANQLIDACLSRAQNHYGLEVIKKIKNTNIIFNAYKVHAKEAYVFEERPKICVEMEKKLSCQDIEDLLEGIKELPKYKLSLAMERMKGGLKKEKQKRLIVMASKTRNCDNLAI